MVEIVVGNPPLAHEWQVRAVAIFSGLTEDEVRGRYTTQEVSEMTDLPKGVCKISSWERFRDMLTEAPSRSLLIEAGREDLDAAFPEGSGPAYILSDEAYTGLNRELAVALANQKTVYSTDEGTHCYVEDLLAAENGRLEKMLARAMVRMEEAAAHIRAYQPCNAGNCTCALCEALRVLEDRNEEE